MKYLKMMVAMLAVSVAVLVQAAAEKQTMPIEKARGQIAAAIANPETMTAIMKQLSPGDQKQFVSDVNAAIAIMPGSTDEKAAAYLATAVAALNGAAEGNMTVVLAEIYATASVESLTVINERLAADVFNRAADPNVTYSDDQYKKIAENVMEKVNERVATADNGDVRSGFAGLMLVRASNSTDPAMTEAIIAMLPESAQTVAKNEWFPAALADGASKSYESMLGAADAGEAPSEDLLTVPTLANRQAMLSDLAGTATDAGVKMGLQLPVYTAVMNPINETLPSPVKGPAGTATDNKVAMSPDAETLKKYEADEPHGYQWQQTR